MPPPHPDDDDSFPDLDPEHYTDSEAEQFDRELRRLAGRQSSDTRARALPEPLAELHDAIHGAALLRRSVVPHKPPIPFDRFEAFDSVVGGMGVVIQARDPLLDRMVAIKLWIQSGPAAQAALLAEARTLAKLSHPNVVTIYETGQWRDRVYFVMEWIDGTDGQRWLEQPRDWAHVRDVFALAGTGLAAAHELGIQHRDFKPANILMGHGPSGDPQGRRRTGSPKIAEQFLGVCSGPEVPNHWVAHVVVADFGVAASLHATSIEEPGTIVGTPAYMAPERLRGEAGDARSDQFSFCAAMWRALHGQRPYAGERPAELLDAIERGQLRTNPDAHAPQWLLDILRKGLAIDPDQRHRDMHELVDALLDEPPLDASPTDLLAGKSWAGWGPAIEHNHLTDEVIALLAQLTDQSLDDVAHTLLRGGEHRRYLLVEQLAGTPSATVHLAVDALLAREVAIKIHRDRHQHARQRAIRESQAMARLEHPNVVKIYDMGEQGQWMYCVIERCDGDLQQWHAVLQLEWADLLTRILEAARGLACLHDAGYAHGDIKPTNILIKNGIAKLADFGHAIRPNTLALHVGGTPGYVAPEVLDHGPSFAGDVFSLAVTAWACLFGELPYPLPDGEVTLFATAERVERRELAEPKKLPEGLPGDVRALLERGLDPDPRARPSLDELIRGLRAVVEKDEQPPQQKRPRVGVIASVVGATLAVGISIGVLSAGRGGEAERTVAEVAMSSTDPLLRAEIAARQGDGETAVKLLYDVWSPDLPKSEQLDVADAAERMATILTAGGHIDEADLCTSLAKFLRRKSK